MSNTTNPQLSIISAFSGRPLTMPENQFLKTLSPIEFIGYLITSRKGIPPEEVVGMILKGLELLNSVHNLTSKESIPEVDREAFEAYGRVTANIAELIDTYQNLEGK